MHKHSNAIWLISMSLIVLVISFLVLYQDTQEPVSSLSAAILAAVLVLGASVTINWLIRVFMK